MLFVIGAYATVIGAAVYCLGVGFFWVFAGFVIIPYLFVIFDIDGDKYLLKTMFLAGFGKIHVPAFKNYLCA
jgi:hypothetical protein